MRASTDDHARFDEIYPTLAIRVFASVRRRTDRDTAEEVVAETFATAWRRIRDVPPEALPWLLVVARNHLANHRRKDYRRRGVDDALRSLDAVSARVAPFDADFEDRTEVLDALAGAGRAPSPD